MFPRALFSPVSSSGRDLAPRIELNDAPCGREPANLIFTDRGAARLGSSNHDRHRRQLFIRRAAVVRGKCTIAVSKKSDRDFNHIRVRSFIRTGAPFPRIRGRSKRSAKPRDGSARQACRAVHRNVPVRPSRRNRKLHWNPDPSRRCYCGAPRPANAGVRRSEKALMPSR
jgi:hypothetical protein